jgi:nucleoside-diphosphate-sugar epimerase
MTARKALVTGGTGFVGSTLVRRLVRDGWKVHLMVRANSGTVLIKDVLDRVTLHEHDEKTECMLGILAETLPDVVFHLASLFLSEHASTDVSRLVQSNVLFGVQLAEAMTAHGVSALINTGTHWQHYENKPYSPVNLYASTKQAFEDILQYYVESRALRVITLKLFDTYGPNDPRPKLFSLLERIAREGNCLDMSLGEQMIDLVHVEDAVQAYVVAADRLLLGKVQGHERYAVSSQSPLKLKDLVEMYSTVTGIKPSIQWGGRPYRLREIMQTVSCLPVLPGWTSQKSLLAGLQTMRTQSHDFDGSQNNCEKWP